MSGPDLLDDHDVIVCCGTGGVGKTTTAAAFGMAAARRGRRVVVVTIDPARRLADAMGLESVGNERHRVEGIGPGELWVTMLDTKATFDALVHRYATDNAQAQRILSNRYYRNLSASLSGTREYMAMEKLYELHRDDTFDLVLVDTPPTRNALDFLAAPDRLTRFLDGRMFRLAMPGTRLMRTVTSPVLALLRRIAKVVSPEVVDDTLAFIEAFSGMEEGFRHRASDVDDLLRSPRTSYVLVTSPSADAVDETRFFVDELIAARTSVGALVVNRMHPDPGGLSSALQAHREAGTLGALEAHVAAVDDLRALALAEREEIAPLIVAAAAQVVIEVPLLDHDVHDLDGIAEIEAHLTR